MNNTLYKHSFCKYHIRQTPFLSTKYYQTPFFTIKYYSKNTVKNLNHKTAYSGSIFIVIKVYLRLVKFFDELMTEEWGTKMSQIL